MAADRPAGPEPRMSMRVEWVAVMNGAFRLRFVVRGEIGGDGAQASDGFAWGAARRDVGGATC